MLTELRLGGSGNVLDCDVVVTCSSGTYVRALARDVGNHLRTGAHVTALRRLRVGSWSIDRACQIEECAARVAEGGALTHVGVDELCRKLFPVFEISAEEADLLRHGQFIAGRSGNPEGIGAAFCADRCVALVTPRGQKLKPHLIVSVK